MPNKLNENRQCNTSKAASYTAIAVHLFCCLSQVLPTHAEEGSRQNPNTTASGNVRLCWTHAAGALHSFTCFVTQIDGVLTGDSCRAGRMAAAPPPLPHLDWGSLFRAPGDVSKRHGSSEQRADCIAPVCRKGAAQIREGLTPLTWDPLRVEGLEHQPPPPGQPLNRCAPRFRSFPTR